MSELGKRVIVALIAAPVAIGASWIGDAALATVIASMAGVAAWELFRMARLRGLAPHDRFGIALAA
ncbi:MAG: phosphatidate cytidylyltransferase, partial [Gemmatimonadaceae bacterium]|nr:phosphatidate cytidylyltransferase [Gemmatimonadaceae bacterium]MCU0626723.1 phosphatidate cytidylyltransferase [Gemmatimonadaceae bacterium]